MNLEFVKFKKIQLENLVDFEKGCKTHILNYFLAKIGVDTAENEHSEVWPACLPASGPSWVK